MTTNNNSNSVSFSTGGLLQTALIILKLLDMISISWWWVFAPTIVGLSILVVVVALIVWAGWDK